MRCTAKVKDGADLLAQMRAAQTMPRGERLASHLDTRDPYAARPRLWWRMWHRREHTAPREHAWSWPDDVRHHAAPLALARERRRRERAEGEVADLRMDLFIAERDGDLAEIERLRAERDTIRAEVARLTPQPITGDTSDGYHTFNELYAHRIALWKSVCRISGGAWRSRKHSDGSEVPGWFILGLGKEPGSQCTYHLPDAEWDACAFAETLDTAPTFDGHTSADVLARLDGLQPPTREEVERAVDALLEALLMCRGLQAARDALVKLATRGT